MAAQGERGFTLIELLVVILIIAILAAIAIPVFLAQRRKGWEAQMQSALKNAALAVESYAVENNGNFAPLNSWDPGADGGHRAQLKALGFQTPAWAMTEPGYMRIRANSTSYCIEARHAQLNESSAWRRSTYMSSVGSPQPTPDTCGSAPY